MMLQALNPKDARVLIVEDNPNDQEIVARALKTFGIRHWRLARTAEDALEEAAKHHYDIILLDYNLPGMNGIQFLEYVQKLVPGTRVIVVTGVRQEAIAVQAMKLGATDYITKDDFLTSGIVRSLQAALREQVSTANSEQRNVLSARSRELQEASIEGAWLLQALDERHGYRPDGSGLRDPLGEAWSDAVRLLATYIQASCQSFPEPATDTEDDLLRLLTQRGVSPRDFFRCYVAAIRQLMSERDGTLEGIAIRPILFLTHILACLVEEQQVLISLRELEALPADQMLRRPDNTAA
jgi:DNA-binding NarL/FixJ family response regulator